MTLQSIIITAVIGIITSAITAYITTRLKMKEERDKWRREFAFKFVEAQVSDDNTAQKMATQFAIGVLVQNPETADREKIFMPPNCRLTVGRAPDCISFWTIRGFREFALLFGLMIRMSLSKKLVVPPITPMSMEKESQVDTYYKRMTSLPLVPLRFDFKGSKPSEYGFAEHRNIIVRRERRERMLELA